MAEPEVGTVKKFIKEIIAKDMENIYINEKKLKISDKNKTKINRIYKAVHSIKGLAMFSESEKIVDIANAAEFVLDSALHENEELNEELIKYIIETHKKIGQMLDKEKIED